MSSTPLVETAESGSIADFVRAGPHDIAALEDLSAALVIADPATDVGGALDAFIQHFGFAAATALSVPTSVVGSYHSTPMCTRRTEYWARAFPQRARRRHPLAESLDRLTRPIVWGSDALVRLCVAGGCRKADALLRESDIAAAVAIPVIARANHIDVVALTTPEEPRCLGALDLVATGIKAAYAQWTLQKRVQTTPAISLTSREAEIARWMAAGKSDWEIGQILRISSKTVNFHAENIKRKCGVATRVQAIVALLGGADLFP